MKLIYQRVGKHYFLSSIEPYGNDALTLFFSDKPEGRVSLNGISAPISNGGGTVFLSSIPNGILTPKVHADKEHIAADAFEKQGKTVARPAPLPEELAAVRLLAAKLEERVLALECEFKALRDTLGDATVF